MGKSARGISHGRKDRANGGESETVISENKPDYLSIALNGLVPNPKGGGFSDSYFYRRNISTINGVMIAIM